MPYSAPERPGRVTLRLLAASDESEFISLVRASGELHHPWMSLPTSPADFQAYLTRYQRPTEESHLVCRRDSGAITGLINISNIIRGRFQNASIAYAAFAPTAGKGYMSEGMRLAVRHAFQDLQLHRLEANIQPSNHASLRLIERAGFRREGYSPEMLFINGKWEGHERWALTVTMAGIQAAPHPSLPGR